jgi:hypothetical protein
MVECEALRMEHDVVLFLLAPSGDHLRHAGTEETTDHTVSAIVRSLSGECRRD